jgi:uncharacterized protein YwqG
MFRKLLSGIFGGGPPRGDEPPGRPPSVTDMTSLERVLCDAGLGQDAAAIARLGRPSVHFDRRPGTAARRGQSKLGGVPDLPQGMAWPIRPAFDRPPDSPSLLTRRTLPDIAAFLDNPQPLSFIAQVNLADAAAAADPAIDLPNSGMLWFFYDVIHSGWGFDPKDAPGFRVIHAPDPAGLAPRETPSTAPALPTFDEVPLDPVRGFDPPLPEGHRFEELGLGKTARQTYDDAYWNLEIGTSHKLGGWAHPIQNPMEQECALVTAGVYCGDAKGWKSDDAKRILAQPNDWTLLFQIDDDEDAGMMWGDVARLYFWIRASDLRARNFDRVWVILQTT